jgi:plasmid stabilization system protein ParE
MAAQTYRLTKQALTDLDEIGDFLRDRSRLASIRVLDGLADTFKMLAVNPEIGTKRDDLHAGLRMFSSPKPANNYAVFCSILPDGVLITDVIHAARNWTDRFHSGDR